MLTNVRVEEIRRGISIPKRRKFVGNDKTLCIKDFFAVGRGKKMGKLACDIHERKVVFKVVVFKVAVYLQRSGRWNSGAAGRQIVDILINNYYSDRDNLRSRTEDHDAKCALSTLFLRSATFHATLL